MGSVSRGPRVVRFLLLALLIGSALGLALPRAAAWLVVNDRVPHADLAIVLSGDPVRRTLAARDLFLAGTVDRILIIPEPPEDRSLETELARLGLIDPSAQKPPPWPARILAASGVPRDRFAFLSESVDGTINESRHVHQALAAAMPRSLAVVTGPLASRRAKFIFARRFAPERVRVFAVPTTYEPVQLARWWTKPRNALQVVTEYQKLLANALMLLTGG